MMASNTFSMNFDAATRKKFAEVTEAYGLTVAAAFKLFAHYAIETRTLPIRFDFLPAKDGREAVEASDYLRARIAQNEAENQQGEYRVMDFASFMELCQKAAERYV